jgi:uroporphyrinogen-III synthase
MERDGLAGLRVVAFESRRSAEMAELIRRHGGEAVVAPSMREVPLERNAAALELLRRLEAGALDVVILLTGVGTRALVEAVEPVCGRERFAALLARTALVARGAKPVAALRELGLGAAAVAPEPNTWRELLDAIDAAVPLAGKRIALQEYGVMNAELVAELERRAASLLRVPVYRWELPRDLGPLRAALARWSRGEVDVALFTSGHQVANVLRVAAQERLAEALRAAAATAVIGSIGPVCTEALRAHELAADFEPEHPKMGHLVAAAAVRARPLLARKRGASS